MFYVVMYIKMRLFLTNKLTKTIKERLPSLQCLSLVGQCFLDLLDDFKSQKDLPISIHMPIKKPPYIKMC